MKTDYDLVIIGAGIHGAGVAQAAAAAGYSVLVLEQYSEAAKGTSSKSSKLIHGGLRYLETAQFKLVYECLRERSYLLKIAPHLVKLVPFHIPVFQKTTRRPWMIMLGLSIYTLFSGKFFNRISRSHWQELDGLSTKGLDAVFSYCDAQTDDARLTRSVLASAQELGADVITCARFEHAHLCDDGCEIEYLKDDVLEKTTVKISAKIMINAAGAWANNVLENIEPTPSRMDIELVQGTHIILPGDMRNLYYLESPQDRRAIFVMPWSASGKNHILVGTTENIFIGDPAEVQPLSSEVSYLLDVYNYYFSQQLKPDDVIDVFAGLRVLPKGSGAVFGRSRDTSFWQDRSNRPRVITIYGGKLTSYRATAERLVRSLRGVLPGRERMADTRTLKLPVVK